MKNSTRQKLQLQIREKLVLSSIAMIAVLVVLLSGLSYFSLSKAYNEAITVARQGFDSVIQAEVQSVVSVLQDYYTQYQDGKITEAQAMELSKNLIRNTRYNGDTGYFEADMADGICAAHMNPTYEGQNRLNTTDKKGNYYIKNIIAAGNQPKGGFSEYYFAKPGEDDVVYKRAFTQKFEPYGWYITSGIYEDDVDAKTTAYAMQKGKALATLILSSILLAVIMVVAMSLLANSISSNLRSVMSRIQMLSSGDLHTPVPSVRTRDETRLLAESTASTINTLHEMIGDIARTLTGMADGDFSVQTDRQYAGDFLPIQESLQQILRSMNHILSQFRQSVNQISAGAAQVSSGAQALSQGTTEQAGSVETASVNLSEVSSQAAGNARKTAETAQLFQEADQEIENGKHQMEQMVRAMNDLNQAMAGVSRITKAIDDLAFQTNILSLNASIEAARAGEAGKGFAVVADEVRTLAIKSADAAQEASGLIEAATRAAAEGTQMVGSTAGSLQKIVDSVEAISQIVIEISQASKEQSGHLEQVTSSVEQISIVIQANSSTAEESAALSQELSAQAQILQEEVSRYRLLEQDTSAEGADAAGPKG